MVESTVVGPGNPGLPGNPTSPFVPFVPLVPLVPLLTAHTEFVFAFASEQLFFLQHFVPIKSISYFFTFIYKYSKHCRLKWFIIKAHIHQHCPIGTFHSE